MKEELIQTLHPHPGKNNKRMSLETYNVLRKNILAILKKSEPTGPQLMQELFRNVKGSYEEGLRSYVETVKLDLEARGIVERVRTKPVTYRLV